MWQRDSAIELSAVTASVDVEAEGSFSLDITPTFSVEKDPFALQSDGDSKTALEVRLNGNEIDIGEEPVKRGKRVRIEKLSGVIAGHNEIYIKASPPLIESMLDHGIRLVLREDGVVVKNKTVWSSQGSLVSGTLSFRVDKSEEDEHDH